jgi:uncharacterized membrane protein
MRSAVAHVRALVPESATPRLVIALALGVAASLVGSKVGVAPGILVGVAVAGLSLVVLGWLVLWPMDEAQTRDHVGGSDESPPVNEVLIVGIPLAALGCIVTFLSSGGSKAGSWPAAVAVLGVAMAWAALHLMYATRYANHYYADPPEGGIDFKGDQPPTFKDFFYFSYNLGMTYQVSDTDVTDPKIRAVVLRHCLLSYVFGTAIVATTINLVVGALSA